MNHPNLGDITDSYMYLAQGEGERIRENQQENYISEMNVIRCRVCIGTGRWEEKRREREKKKITELKACCRICIFKKWQREETRENY